MGSRGDGDWRSCLQRRLGHSRVRADASLRPWTTLQIEARAQAAVEVHTPRDLWRLLGFAREREVACYLLGRGSNLFPSADVVRGVVFRLGRQFRQITWHGSALVTAGAALPNGVLVRVCQLRGRGGLEFLATVPGSIGGAVAMNAGAHGHETASRLIALQCLDNAATLTVRSVAVDRAALAYRYSPYGAAKGRIVLSATFGTLSSDSAVVAKTVAVQRDWRRVHQPRQHPNGGSAFKNPPGDHAARLIEAAGIKGLRQGALQISLQHANFIINHGGATPADVHRLLERTQQAVAHRFGVTLIPELQPLQPLGKPGAE